MADNQVLFRLLPPEMKAIYLRLNPDFFPKRGKLRKATREDYDQAEKLAEELRASCVVPLN